MEYEYIIGKKWRSDVSEPMRPNGDIYRDRELAELEIAVLRKRYPEAKFGLFRRESLPWIVESF